jgi:hypothetical protein
MKRSDRISLMQKLITKRNNSVKVHLVPMAGLCEQDNKPSCCIIDREFPEEEQLLVSNEGLGYLQFKIV